MQINLQHCIYDFVFPDEGGFVIRSTEPGGAGDLGVSFLVFATWEAAHGRPHPTFDDLKSMPKSEAAEIYTALYASPLHFNDLPSGVDYCVLDSGINDGVHGSTELLQRAMNVAPVTGKFSDDLLKRAQEADPKTIINAHCDLCLARKKANPEWAQWGPGWTRRIERRRTRSLAMIGA